MLSNHERFENLVCLFDLNISSILSVANIVEEGVFLRSNLNYS